MRVLITGSTDGIGLECAKMVVQNGHELILHGRSEEKIKAAIELLQAINAKAKVDYVLADLSSLKDVQKMAHELLDKKISLDVLVNNAGVYQTSKTLSVDDYEIRFAVNTLAPYLLTKLLLPTMNSNSRIINLSSAAQAPINLEALKEKKEINAGEAYAQSKLALTMWSFELAKQLDSVIIAVNPKSFLGSKMVKEAYGIAGSDLKVGAKILFDLSFEDQYKTHSGEYFDNDIGSFSKPHPDALDRNKCQALLTYLDELIKPYI